VRHSEWDIDRRGALRSPRAELRPQPTERPPRALKCLTIDELNPELLAEKNEITPGARVAFDELTNELPDSSCRLPNGGAPLALPDFDLFVQLTLQGELHVPRN